MLHLDRRGAAADDEGGGNENASPPPSSSGLFPMRAPPHGSSPVGVGVVFDKAVTATTEFSAPKKCARFGDGGRPKINNLHMIPKKENIYICSSILLS